MTATSISSSAPHAEHDAGHRFEDAERRLLDEYDIEAHSRRLPLSDPALTVRVLETGAGEPLVLLHGSAWRSSARSACAPSWASASRPSLLAGMRGDPFFRAMTTPGVRALVSRAPVPRTVRATRRASTKALGRHAASLLPDAYFELMRATMAMPGWSRHVLPPQPGDADGTAAG